MRITWDKDERIVNIIPSQIGMADAVRVSITERNRRRMSRPTDIAFRGFMIDEIRVHFELLEDFHNSRYWWVIVPCLREGGQVVPIGGMVSKGIKFYEKIKELTL